MAAKIRGEHLSALYDIVAPLDTPELRDKARGLGLSDDNYRGQLMREAFRRNEWKWFHLVSPAIGIPTDGHLKTAMRQIVPSLRVREA